VAIAVLGLLVLFRPASSALSPQKRAPEPVHVEVSPASMSESAPVAARAPVPVAVDPLESTRKAPPAQKPAPKASALASIATPIAASMGKGPDRFAVRDRNVSAFFTVRGVTVAMVDPKETKGPNGTALNWGVEGAPAIEPQPGNELPTRINRLIGKSEQWQTDLPSYSSIVYPQVQPGVDLTVESRPHGFKYTLQMASGSDPAALQFHYEGAGDIQVSPDGQSVQVVAGQRVLTENELHCWQDGPAGKIPVAARYQRTGRQSYAIIPESYNSDLPLTVDPVVGWASFLGGTVPPGLSGDDYGGAIVADGGLTGNVYIGGYTYSVDFPTTAGVFRTAHSVTADAFVTKLNSTGGMVWSTLLAGDSSDVINAIGLDSSLNIVVAGYTYSTNFPTTAGAFKTGNPFSTSMGFVTKLNTAGSGLIWSTLLGGPGASNYTVISALAIDSSNQVCVTGYTGATSFPTVGAFQASNAGSTDAFVTKISSDGTALVFSSYLGGSNSDYGAAIAQV